MVKEEGDRMTDGELSALLQATSDVAADIGHASAGEQAKRTAGRLRDSVVRPLRHAAGGTEGDGGPAYGRPGARGQDGRRPSGGGKAERLADVLWDLARTATRLRVRVRYPDAAELTEATAALHDLAIGLADESSAVARLAELAELQAGLDPGIRVMTNGPYLVTNAARLLDWLGQPLPVRPQLALCRCGGSRIKPLCDGTHAAIGSAGDKDPGRVQDSRDTYPG